MEPEVVMYAAKMVVAKDDVRERPRVNDQPGKSMGSQRG